MNPELEKIKQQLNTIKNAIVQIEWQIQLIEQNAQTVSLNNIPPIQYQSSTTANAMRDALLHLRRDPQGDPF